MLSYRRLLQESKKSVTHHIGTISEYGLQDAVNSYTKLVDKHLKTQGIDPKKADKKQHLKAHLYALNTLSTSEDVARLRPSKIKAPDKVTGKSSPQERRNKRIRDAYDAMGPKGFHDTAYDIRNTAHDIIHHIYTHHGRINSGHFAGTLDTKGMQRLIHGKEEGEVPRKADMLFNYTPHKGGEPQWFSASLKTDSFTERKPRKKKTLKEAVEQVKKLLIETKVATHTPKTIAAAVQNVDPSLGKDLENINRKHSKNMSAYLAKNKHFLDATFAGVPADQQAKKHYQQDKSGNPRMLYGAWSHIRDQVRAHGPDSEVGRFYAGVKELQRAHARDSNSRLAKTTQAMIDHPDRQKAFDTLTGTQKKFTERIFTVVRNPKVNKGWGRSKLKVSDPTSIDWKKRKLTLKNSGGGTHSVYVDNNTRKAGYSLGADFSRGGEIRYNAYINSGVFAK